LASSPARCLCFATRGASRFARRRLRVSDQQSWRHQAPAKSRLDEVRGTEAFDLLQLLNTGHSGTLSTIHASFAQQGLARFTSCVLQSGIDLPYRAIKTNIADSLTLPKITCEIQSNDWLGAKRR
jgi:Tfp pilus assembly ATPase PilU